MRTEREKMLAGELYDPLDPELLAGRHRARDLCGALNATGEGEPAERRRILTALFGAGGDTVWMQPPSFWDYGANIELGERVIGAGSIVTRDVPGGVFAARTSTSACTTRSRRIRRWRG